MLEHEQCKASDEVHMILGMLAMWLDDLREEAQELIDNGDTLSAKSLEIVAATIINIGDSIHAGEHLLSEGETIN